LPDPQAKWQLAARVLVRGNAPDIVVTAIRTVGSQL